jgi:hypothetical protein
MSFIVKSHRASIDSLSKAYPDDVYLTNGADVNVRAGGDGNIAGNLTGAGVEIL